MENKNKISYYRNDTTGELTTSHKKAVLDFFKYDNVALLNSKLEEIGEWIH